MYAVIETGGKQYRVEVGTEVEVELLDASAGETVTLDRVLLVSDGDEASIGRPLVASASKRPPSARLPKTPSSPRSSLPRTPRRRKPRPTRRSRPSPMQRRQLPR